MSAAHRTTRKVNQNPHVDPKDFEEDLLDSGLVVDSSTIQRHLYKYDLHARVI